MLPIAIQGILFDQKSSYLRGPAKAPELIREQLYSDMSNTYAENGIDIRQNLISDLGDFSITEYSEIEAITGKHLKGSQRLLTLGGDHSVTSPIIKAHAQVYSDIEILHIDAHADLYEEFEGDPYSHACPFARIMEGKYASRLVQVGIRTLNTHQRDQADKYSVEIIEMKEIGDGFVLPVFEKPVYISLDMDALDPAFAPGVSHHEPGGLSTRQVISMIQSIDVPIIGADIVEYNPERDINNMTATVASKLMKEILSKMIENG